MIPHLIISICLKGKVSWLDLFDTGGSSSHQTDRNPPSLHFHLQSFFFYPATEPPFICIYLSGTHLSHYGEALWILFWVCKMLNKCISIWFIWYLRAWFVCTHPCNRSLVTWLCEGVSASSKAAGAWWALGEQQGLFPRKHKIPFVFNM